MRRVAIWLSVLAICGLILSGEALFVAASCGESVVGRTETVIPNANGYCAESALGDVVSDALRTETGVQISIVFSGDLALYLMSGELTLSDIEAAIPQNTQYFIVELSHAELVSVLESGVSSLTLTEAEKIDYKLSECSNFPQISGCSFRCDASAPVGERILSVVLDDGSELDLNDSESTVTVALPESALNPNQLAKAQSCGGLQDVFLKYLAENSPITKPELRRIRVLGAHTNELISSGPMIMVGIIILVCVTMAIPSILQKKKNQEERESVYFTGVLSLQNKK